MVHGQKDSIAQETDPVLWDMERAQTEYRERLADWERREEELIAQITEAQFRASAAQKERVETLAELESTRAEIERERVRADQQRERARELARLLKDIHRALFSGNVYDLILRACLTITGSMRGLYITVGEDPRSLRIRAAVDVDGYPKDSPSSFIKAICSRVLESDQTLVCLEEGDFQDFPRSRPNETFRNMVAAPVVLLKHLNGVIMVGDKLHGKFDEDDIDALLSIGNQASVAVENTRLRRDLQNAYLSTVGVLADAIEAKDPYTHGHCEMVSAYSRLIAEQLELTDEERNVVCYAALLHDSGKIGVSDGILNKPGPLLDEERELVRSHVRVGHDLVSKVPSLEGVADVVLHHHEWYDGSGYPDGLSGDQIPMAARIVGVVDAYAAMVTQRSYKPAYSEERAREELQRCSGTQFDPDVVKALLHVLDLPKEQRVPQEDEAECGLLPGFEQMHMHPLRP